MASTSVFGSATASAPGTNNRGKVPAAAIRVVTNALLSIMLMIEGFLKVRFLMMAVTGSSIVENSCS
jgi:hypothetical protein